MRFYEVTNAVTGAVKFYGTMAYAHDEARSIDAPGNRVFIDLVEVPTDKDGLLALLNAPSTARIFPTIQSWNLTARGGMTEIPTRGREVQVPTEPDADATEPEIMKAQQSPGWVDSFEFNDEWLTASAHYGLDPDQFDGDTGMRATVIAAHRRLA